MPFPMLSCNCVPATLDDLRALALRNYGHFTTMQVRGYAVRGLQLHLQRLDAATRELFGVPLPGARVREALRAALEASDIDDCTARVTVFSRSFDIDDPARSGEIDLLVALHPPMQADGAPLRVCSVVLERPLPHLKHVATLPLLHARRQARLAGFDDALLVAAEGGVREGVVWNVGFVGDDGVTWPDAPMLRGTTLQLVQAGLAGQGLVQSAAPLLLEDLGRFRGAFALNSRGIQPLAQVDGIRFDPQSALLAAVRRALEAAPWEPLAE